jgi:hypothetical protein
MAWVVMEARGESSHRPPFGVLGEWSVLDADSTGQCNT